MKHEAFKWISFVWKGYELRLKLSTFANLELCFDDTQRYKQQECIIGVFIFRQISGEGGRTRIWKGQECSSSCLGV